MKLYGELRIYILTPLPRYILLPCCDDSGHCAILTVKDDVSRQGVFDIMDELDMISKAVSIKFPGCTESERETCLLARAASQGTRSWTP